jgi:DNA-binding NtrC family response regulator
VAEALGRSPYEAIVLEFPLGGWSAAGLLEAARRLAPGVPVLIRAAPADAPEVMHLTGRGAAQFLADGAQGWVQLGCVLEGIRKGGLARLAERAQREDWEGLLVGESPELRQVMHIVRLVASRRCTVLITGETGTGKEMVARCLHLAGTRRRGPLVAVDCSALPENLLETELFGHVRGAFTGAVQNRTGRFEQAHGGTLFLDEIGELPPPVQVKLLRVLQEREFQRLGSSETVRTDVRVIAATNCDLPRAIERGLFREDLYYRLNVVPIQMPSLRQRPDDVPILAMHFVEKICHNEQIEPKSLAPEALARLRGHAWPGNVRQLENAVEMAVALSGERRILTALDFPLPEAPARSAAPGEFPLVALPDQGLNYERTLAAVERSILEQALRKTGGNKKAAAEMLGLKRTTLAAKVRTLAVEALC